MLKAKIPLSLKSFLKFNTCILNYDDLISLNLQNLQVTFTIIVKTLLETGLD